MITNKGLFSPTQNIKTHLESMIFTSIGMAAMKVLSCQKIQKKIELTTKFFESRERTRALILWR
jgi:hypothetical protein